MSTTRLGLIALLALVAGVYFSCRTASKPVGPAPSPPVAPTGLYAFQTFETSVVLRWDYSSGEEQGFRIYKSLDSTGSYTKVDSAGFGAHEATVDSLLGGTNYFFYVTAYNHNGESGRSNVRRVQTASTTGLTPPTNVTATVFEGDSVRVGWTPGNGQTNFIVQRRDTTSSQWTILDSLVDPNAIQYYDTTVVALGHYYYRVGAENTTGTVWSADSALAVIPTPGPPVAPVNLHAQVIVGTGVVLSWTNVSHVAEGIIIYRQYDGGPGYSTIDTVGPTFATYTDSLGDTFNLYYYRLQAFNSFGHSPLTPPITVDYRLRSPGLIPMAVGNEWNYDVSDTIGSSIETHRIRTATFFQGQDFYLFTQTRGVFEDSVYYLRNDSTAQPPGSFMLHWPPRQDDHPQLLFKYPVARLDSYFVDGNKVQVVSTGEDINVGGTVYHVVLYEWFISPTFRIIYYIKPFDVGIIREQHYTGPVGSPQLSKTLNLRSYSVG